MLTADADTWQQIAADLRGGMDAYRASRLSVRRNLHVGVGFLAATNGATEPGRLRFHTVATRRSRLSVVEAGLGPPVLALHGLGGHQGVLPADSGGTGATVPGDRGRSARVRRLRQADRRLL